MSTKTITARDRLCFAIFLSTVMQLTLIIGITFKADKQESSASYTLEVVLALTRSQYTPEKADFIAQANQIGSGTLEEEAIISTDQEADFTDNVIR